MQWHEDRFWKCCRFNQPLSTVWIDGDTLINEILLYMSVCVLNGVWQRNLVLRANPLISRRSTAQGGRSENRPKG